MNMDAGTPEGCSMETQTRDYSPLALFLQADWVVKAIMLLLIAASVIVWAIAIDRSVRLSRLRRQALILDGIVRDPSQHPGPGLAGAILAAGHEAADDHPREETRSEYRERIREAMRLTLGEGLRRIEPGLPFLATVGSTAPFVGLFGTVWGIMTSFTGIAAKSDASLAVVAPGIAEALFSTAIGLAAAIPAVVAYNRLSNSLARSRTIAIAAITRLANRLTAGRPSARQAAE
jgi:biopolymer transport protein TolQ